jgi:hypothetical protein
MEPSRREAAPSPLQRGGPAKPACAAPGSGATTRLPHRTLLCATGKQLASPGSQFRILACSAAEASSDTALSQVSGPEARSRRWRQRRNEAPQVRGVCVHGLAVVGSAERRTLTRHSRSASIPWRRRLAVNSLITERGTFKQLIVGVTWTLGHPGSWWHSAATVTTCSCRVATT